MFLNVLTNIFVAVVALAFHASESATLGPDALMLLQVRAERLEPLKKNVLFFLIDDLRPQLGAYNVTFMPTPHIDSIAREGVTFTRAYANFPWCAPSRNSLLSGRLPDKTRVFNFADHFRERGIGDGWQSLPEFFKVRGYRTSSAGKFFHKMKPPNNDYPRSWSSKPFTPFCLPPECPDSTAKFKSKYNIKTDCVMQGHSWCAIDIDKDEKDEKRQLVDQRVADSCIHLLEEAALDPTVPFFVGCGFHKPHAPWVFPAEFLKRFPQNIEDIPLPAHPGFTLGMPRVAGHRVQDIQISRIGDDLNTSKRYNRLAYYATVAYVDHLVGKVLDSLETLGQSNDTVVVLTGDHGWHLGEQGLWGKMTNFEHGLRVPLLVKAPWLRHSRGQVTDTLAELVDLYPTLAELAGLPHPHAEGESVDGTSLLPILMDPSNVKLARETKQHALSQVAKPSVQQPDSLSVSMRRNETEIMGYSLRTHEWRYTAWFKMDTGNQVPIRATAELLGRELYDHGEDGNRFDRENGGFDSCQEMWNRAHDSEHQDVVEELHRRLESLIQLQPTGGSELYEPEEGWIVAL